MKILLIDDESSILENLHDYLTAEGHVVEDASNGEVAWNCFIQKPDTFDLIVSDINMPGWDGFDFLQRLREENFMNPIVFITGRKNNVSLRNSSEVAGLLYKPFRLSALGEILKRIGSNSSESPGLLSDHF